MANNCVWIPDAENGKQSKLFVDLMNHIGNREDAKMAWGLTKTEFFKSAFPNIAKDENGEPTYQALSDALNLDSILDDIKKDMNRAMDLGLVSAKGRAIPFDDARVLLSRAREFNKNAKKKIALVEKTADGKYIASIEDNTVMSVAEADKNIARRNLNVALLELLQKKLGFNVEFADDPSFDGVFDPHIAEKNAENLRTVIQIFRGEKGLEALPEEASHLILAGMKGHTLKNRLDNIFTDDMVKKVLGDEYYRYYNLYKNGKTPVKERLRDEAEGQMLRDALMGNMDKYKNISAPKRSGIMNVLMRIWNGARSIFNKNIQVKDIDNAFSNAQNAILPIADMTLSGDIDTVLDREAVMKSERMYATAEQAQKLLYVAQQMETNLSKQLNLLNQTQKKHDTKELRSKIQSIRNDIENGKYQIACYQAVLAISTELSQLTKEMNTYASLYNNSTDLETILAEGDVVERIKFALEAYEPIVNTLLQIPELIRNGQIEMDPAWTDPIMAIVVGDKERPGLQGNIATLKENMNDMRFSVLKQFLSLYYGVNGEKPENVSETDKWKWESIGDVLRHAERDITWWDTNLFSAGDSRNMLINIVHNVVVRQQGERNQRIIRYCAKMQEAEAKLHKSGYDNNFVVDTDENGVPTGYYKSERDFARYEREREAYAKTLDEENPDMDPMDKEDKIREWESKHTEFVYVGKPDAKGRRRRERMPKMDIYPVSGWVKDENTNRYYQKDWSKEQRDYYDAILDMKDEMDEMLPGCYKSKYMMPQISRSATQAFDKGGRGFWGTIWRRWKTRWSIVEENIDYGHNYDENKKAKEGKKGNVTTLTDYNGRPIMRVPVYFVHKLEDMRDLNTDATRGMFNYICMAVNFSEMGKISSVMRLLKDHVKEQYQVTKRRGAKKVIDSFSAIGRNYEREAVAVGMDTKVARHLDEYIDRIIFNETKAIIGNIDISDEKSLSGDALFNAFMRMTSVSRMGFNLLSGITNATQGETQILSEAMTNRFFNIKDFGWMKKEYHKLLLPYIGDFNSSDRHDKMYMLINTFNSSEDFFRDMMDKDFNKSPFKRVLGRGNVYFLNTMGEHYLHTGGMLMVLHHEKVRRLSDKKEMTLYEALKPVNDGKGWHLELDGDIEFIDKDRAFLQNTDLAKKNGVIKKSDSNLLFKNLAIYINRINANMHGGYSEAEKGNINRYALGRLVLQFRQWMFGMYNKNFTRGYFQASTNTYVEGAYITAWRQLRKFFTGTLYDLKNMSLKEALEKNRLSDAERKNAMIAYANTAIYLMLFMLGRLAMGWKDKDDRSARLLAYQIKRLELETGALCPVNPYAFFNNILTLVQSPAAGMSTLKELLPLFDLFSATDEISSGRYTGWSRAGRALYRITPIYNIGKVVDMKDYNYMFNIF